MSRCASRKISLPASSILSGREGSNELIEPNQSSCSEWLVANWEVTSCLTVVRRPYGTGDFY